jgi:DnaJ-class molecular chaperone
MAEMPPEMMVLCPSCMGEKVDYAELESEECSECDGLGELEEVLCPTCEGEGCPACFGEGKLYNLLCPMCEGAGINEYPPQCRACRGTGWRPHPDFMEVK